MKSLFVASFMGVVGVSCTESRDDRCQVIDIGRNMETMLRLNTEDISEDVRYVPLETSDESLIGDRAYVRMLGGKLLVASLNQPVKMFDASTGKFIRSVGAIGNGPEEYVPQDGVPVFFVDEAAGCIWIKAGGNRMLRFDGEGLPVDAVTVADSTILLSGVSQIAVNGKLYFYQPTLFSKPAYKMSVYDVQTGKTDNWIPNDKEAVEMELQQTPVLFGGYGSVPVVPACHIFSLKGNRYALSYQEDPCLWNYGGKIFLKERFNDTIYTASKGLLAPRYVFELGDWHCPYGKRFDVDGSSGRISIDYVLEGRRCLYFVFQTDYYNMRDKKTFFGIYDKETGGVKISDSDEIASEGGRPVVRQLQTAASDGKLLGLIPASEYDASRAEDDNPVAVILY